MYHVENGVSKSLDSGVSWRKILDDDKIYWVVLDRHRLFAISYATGVSISTDGGEHWVAASSGLSDFYFQDVRVDPRNPDIVYAATNSGLFVGDMTTLGITVDARVDGGHGEIDPPAQTVNYGGDAVISIIPDPGYRIAAIADNGVAMPIANPYRIANVQEAHTVVVTFVNEPPYARIMRPADDATVCGAVTVQADAGDDSGVANVTLSVDGAALGTLTRLPFAWTWNALATANGWHTLRVTAYDAAGASAQASVRVNVQNLVLHVCGQRLTEKGWLVKWQYARLDISVDNASVPVTLYELQRATESGAFVTIKMIAPTEFTKNRLTCIDAPLDKSRTYRYRARAFDDAHALLGESEAAVLAPLTR
jgi:hypothetical protein